ncbi:MAG: CPBP family intramembrane metalloprotease [Sphingomonadales bacterium]|nr:CPBP family intramembrane metalloprotease [Sphingomonadales bacterium]
MRMNIPCLKKCRFAVNIVNDSANETATTDQNPFYSNWGLMFVLIFIFLFNIIFSLGSAFIAGGIYGITFNEARNLLTTPDGTALAINISRVYHLISFIGSMLLPVWLFTIVNRSSLIREGGLNTPFKSTFLWMGLVTAGSGFVIVNWLDSLMRSINWPQGLQYYAQQMDASRQEMTTTLLDMNEPHELIVCLFLVAFLPAVIEELLFRGVLQNIFKGITGNIIRAIVLQAFVFATLHFSFYELPGIFLLGLAFGYLRSASGSTLYGMVAHFLFNGTAIFLHYLSQLNFRQTGISGTFDNIAFGNVISLLALVPFVYSIIWYRRIIKST